jgi:hypothetical protein
MCLNIISPCCPFGRCPLKLVIKSIKKARKTRRTSFSRIPNLANCHRATLSAYFRNSSSQTSVPKFTKKSFAHFRWRVWCHYASLLTDDGSQKLESFTTFVLINTIWVLSFVAEIVRTDLSPWYLVIAAGSLGGRPNSRTSEKRCQKRAPPHLSKLWLPCSRIWRKPSLHRWALTAKI